MVASFFAWWLRQLLGLLPAAWRPGAAAAEDVGDAVMLSLSSSGQPPVVEAARRRRKRLLRLGRFTLDAAGLAALRTAVGAGRHGPVRLLLPPPMLLEQAVTLPLQAERGLDTALRWEMDRLTPFTADAVHWAWTVTHRDRSRGQLELRLLLVAKSAVQSALAALGSAGLAPARLEAAGDPGRLIDLDGPRRAAPRRPVLLSGLALCAALALAATAIPFFEQQQKLDRLDARMAALRPQVDVAETIRRRVADRATGAQTVAGEAARVGDALRVLATLTELLPDGTSLYDLSLRDRIVTFSGQSKQAAVLIPLLAADPAIRNPVFSAAVTRNDLTGTEAFSIPRGDAALTFPSARAGGPTEFR